VTPGQAILLVGGLANLTFSTLAGFALYWLRMRDVSRPPPRYALITHTSATTGGLVLIALSVAIVHTGFTEPINVLLAVGEVAAVVLIDVRNIVSWGDRIEDGMADVSETRRRLRGFANILHFVVISALTYGVARTALGI
jgi:hypothetical protein